MNPNSIPMIQKQLTTYIKIKLGSILIVYYKSHVVSIRVILVDGNRKIIWVTIIKIYCSIVFLIKYCYNCYIHLINLQYY